MRGLAPQLGTPHPIAATLPSLLAQDGFLQRLCGGLDDVLAPVFATLDAFPAYLDPRTTPDDMIAWLASWIGLTFEAGQTPERRRELLVAGAQQLGWRGTMRGVRGAIEAVFSVAPEIVESGGAAFSAVAGGVLPGNRLPRLLVRLRVPDPASVDTALLDALVTAVKPAHVPHTVEVLAIHEAAPDPGATPAGAGPSVPGQFPRAHRRTD